MPIYNSSDWGFGSPSYCIACGGIRLDCCDGSRILLPAERNAKRRAEAIADQNDIWANMVAWVATDLPPLTVRA